MEKEDVIEIVQINGELDVKGKSSRATRWSLVINGEEIDEERAFIPIPERGEKRNYTIIVRNDILAKQLLQYRLTIFPDNLAKVIFKQPIGEYDSFEPRFRAINFRDNGEVVFTFMSAISVYNWNRYYTINDYLEILRSIGPVRYPGFFVQYGEDLMDDLYERGAMEAYLRFPYNGIDKRGIEVMEELKEICYLIYHEAILSFSQKDKHSVEVVLDLPPNVKVACEQYLLYFVQFLKDLGIEASSELKHDAGQVLFSVTPTNKGEALDKIRTALEVYLRLPSGRLAVASNDPVEIQRLSANILHLQSQLMLAHAMIQHKDAAIQLQQATIQKQQRLLAENEITQSVVDITPKKAEDKEEFLGGALALTQIEKGGVRVNLAEIFRMLKRWFQED